MAKEKLSHQEKKSHSKGKSLTAKEKVSQQEKMSHGERKSLMV